jgi:[ribosomal protein S18]-alanine N-acetyltransferase
MGKRQADVASPSHQVRWMIRRDMYAVLEIERQAFEFPWREEDFIRALRQRNVIGAVVEDSKTETVRGFMIYELHKNRLHILNIAVAAEHRGRGYGRHMVEKLIGKLSHERRNRIMTEVRETNLDAQMFFKAMRFRAISVLRDFYDDTTEDAYLMQYRHTPTPDELLQLSDANRMTRMAG